MARRLDNIAGRGYDSVQKHIGVLLQPGFEPGRTIAKRGSVNENSRNGAHAKTCTARRIRVGLTGLAAIFLMVMVAAAGMRPARSVAPLESQGETLTVLGVAPSSGASASLHPEPAPPADAAPR